MSHPDFEKTPFASKKFSAFFLAEISWKVLLGIAIAGSIKILLDGGTIPIWLLWVELAMVFVSGFVEVTFIGKQADLDKFVRLAALGFKGPTGKTPTPPETPDDV